MSDVPPEVPPPEPRDEAILAVLRDAWSSDDTIPDPSVAVAREALAWRRVDEELAELRDQVPVAGVRGNPRGSSFVAEGQARVDIDVAPVGGRRVVTGQITPADAASVTWEGPRGRSGLAAVDEGGMFELRDVAKGTVRFVFNRAAGPTIHTDWLTI